MACTRWIRDCFRRSGATEEERSSLLHSPKKNVGSSLEEKTVTRGSLQTENYHAVDIAPTKNQLVEQVKKSITKKMSLAQHPPFARRHSFNIFSFLWISTLLAAIADLACHASNASHVTQQKLDQYTTDNVEPLWLALPANCTQKAEKYLGSPDECVSTGPKFVYADGGAALINFVLKDPNLEFCNDDIITLFRKCCGAPLKSTELIKNIYMNAWEEQLIILFFAGLLSFLHYLQLKQYIRDTTLSHSDISALNVLTALEKDTSGICFTNLESQIGDMYIILLQLDFIKFSQNEIEKHDEFLQARKTFLNSIFPTALVEIIIDVYLSGSALSAPKYHSFFRPDLWQREYAAFFRSMRCEQEDVAADRMRRSR